MVILVGRSTHAQAAAGEGALHNNNNNNHHHRTHRIPTHRPVHTVLQLDQAEQLPHGWKSGADASCGRQCYFHLETKSSSWISPCDTSVPSEGRYPPELRIGISIEQVWYGLKVRCAAVFEVNSERL